MTPTPEPDMVELLLGCLLLLWHGSALVEVANSEREGGSKLRWFLAILILMPFGLIAWWVSGRDRSRPRYLGVAGYMSIAIVSVAVLLGLTREMWEGAEYMAWMGAWSVVTFLMYAFDKGAAKEGKDDRGKSKASRINEVVLHLCSLLGGFVGGWIGRHALRHKTKKIEFGAVLLVATALHVTKIFGLW